MIGHKYSTFGNVIAIAENKLIEIVMIYFFQICGDLDVKMVNITRKYYGFHERRHLSHRKERKR